jgi:hypothetical protein
MAALGVGGCNLVFGLDEPQDDDDGPGGDGGVDAPRTYGAPEVLFIPDARNVAVLSGGVRPGQRLVIGSAAGALFHVVSDAGRDVSATSSSVEPPAAVAAIQADGDGISDLLVTQSTGIVFYPGTNDGTLVAELELTEVGSSLIAVGAYETAAPDDLVVGHVGSLGIGEWLGNGQAGFGSTPGFTSDGVPQQIVAVDVDGDGVDELIVADTVGVRMYRRFPSGFAAMGDTLTGPILALTALRLDGNPTFDILIGDATGTIAVWFGDGDGGFQQGPSLVVEQTTSMALAHGDLDGDGLDDDLMVAAGGAVSLFIAGDDGELTAGDRFVVGEVSALAFADLDGDAQDDLVVLLPAADQVLIFFAQ